VVSFCYFFPRRVLAAHGTGTTGGPTSPRTGLCCRYLYSKPCRVLSHFLSLQPPVRALGQTCEKISLASLVFICRAHGYALRIADATAKSCSECAAPPILGFRQNSSSLVGPGKPRGSYLVSNGNTCDRSSSLSVIRLRRSCHGEAAVP
jgi:hypothetical protein